MMFRTAAAMLMASAAAPGPAAAVSLNYSRGMPLHPAPGPGRAFQLALPQATVSFTAQEPRLARANPSPA